MFMKRLISVFALVCGLCCGCGASVKDYVVEVVREYPHSTDAYTQGLFFYRDTLRESTGGYGNSFFRSVDLQSGETLNRMNFARKYFGEGSVVLGDNLYVLTWESNVAFVYDADTREYRGSYSFPREGWGLTTDGESLIASDGSAHLYFLDPEMKLRRTVRVTLNDHSVRYLNELEWIDGRIWANVYTTDWILIINPRDGKVEGRIDCSGLLPQNLRTASTDVLNGIARDPSTGKIYLTGKNWPRLYEIKIIPSKK